MRQIELRRNGCPYGLHVHSQLRPLYFLYCVLDVAFSVEYYTMPNIYRKTETEQDSFKRFTCDLFKKGYSKKFLYLNHPLQRRIPKWIKSDKLRQSVAVHGPLKYFIPAKKYSCFLAVYRSKNQESNRQYCRLRCISDLHVHALRESGIDSENHLSHATRYKRGIPNCLRTAASETIGTKQGQMKIWYDESTELLTVEKRSGTETEKAGIRNVRA